MKTIITRSKRTCQFPQIWHVSALAPAAVGDVLPCIANQITCIWIYIWDTAHLLHTEPHCFCIFHARSLTFPSTAQILLFGWPQLTLGLVQLWWDPRRTRPRLSPRRHWWILPTCHCNMNKCFFNISDRSENLVPTQSIIHAHGCLHTLDSWSKSGTAEAVPTTAKKTASIVYQ